jgi:uncharacterized LabA/DUF88 family protein
LSKDAAHKSGTKRNTIYVFIDASNLWQAQKAKGRFLDYEKLVTYIKKQYEGTSISVYYYTAYPAEGTRQFSLDGKHKFFTFLKKGLGFEVRKKALKRITVVDEHGEAIQEKGNMDVEMTIDAVHHSGKFDTAVLFTGDSDFLALVTNRQTRPLEVRASRPVRERGPLWRSGNRRERSSSPAHRARNNVDIGMNFGSRSASRDKVAGPG